jgi:hypothetical protein
MGRLVSQIKLERFDGNYRLLERRVQPMRSWTRGLIDILYTYAYQIPAAAPFSNLGDVNNAVRLLFDTNSGTTYRQQFSNGKVVGAGGFAGEPSTYPFFLHQLTLMGCDIGIQVGNDNTAATPTDKRLSKRIGHGIRPADGGNVTFIDVSTGDDAAEIMQNNDNSQVTCPFIPQQDIRIYEVELKVYKTGVPTAALTVDIRPAGNWVNGAYPFNQPSLASPILATGTIAEAAIGAAPGAFVACAFGTPVDLYAGHLYFIVTHSAGVDGAKFYHWRYDTTGNTYDGAPGFTRAENTYDVTATDAWAGSGTNSWGRQLMFKVIGRSVGNLEYGGMELVHRVTANPNDAFDLKRFFYNRSGVAIDVAEVGIQAMVIGRAVAGSTYEAAFPVLIARDVVSPLAVTVANTEILLVTYTPAIVV